MNQSFRHRIVCTKLLFVRIVALCAVAAGPSVELNASSESSRPVPTAPGEIPATMHRLDLELERATDGMSPTSQTAAIYRDFVAKWDTELNRVYRLLLAELGPKEREMLRESQRQWVKLRDADEVVLAKIYYTEGRATPTMYVSFHAYAVMNLTRERALLLLSWLDTTRELKAARENN